jgi:hypothetical protein
MPSRLRCAPSPTSRPRPVAFFVHPDLGAYLVAAGLLAHSGCDLHHYRTNRVVIRSLADFCLVLDATLALVIVFVTALS